ncbi:hypothetical protein JX266_000061 [Neoarthrinium moseri]|uniref:uncharacterized protein n=1 Tax=Neoarthrinium moseri TaxID=1658444 RepID=UPI001FDD4521|nr:uncharacterized protein JN550_002970 [Neoarthrinium moseri]KAI1855196.1 hypothetical protein JX266_000061 [Neoarthrinium moseri]KAI1873701.1 hypothetical protein JN550_002970 [Neoarthrinium moseri]
MPAETRGSVRQRKGKATTKADGLPPLNARVTELNSSDDEAEEKLQEEPKPKPTPKARAESEDEYSPWLDIARVLTFLLVASAGLSYLISGGDSFTWGLKHPPKYLRRTWWEEQFKSPLSIPIEELAQYDGTDPEKPIYLAINGTIYDVTANRRTYGPGGSYHVFAGADAARGFVTGCFADDRTADLRGIEEMHLPRDDPEIDAQYTAAQLAELREKELGDARQKVHDQLAHWVRFFEKNPKYPRVGFVKREKGWLEKEPRRKLCDQAEKGRPKRKAPGQE